MSNSKLTAVAALTIFVTSIAYSFAMQTSKTVVATATNPFEGKVLYLDSTPGVGVYGVQENVKVQMVGSESFLVLQPFRRKVKKDGTEYDEQHWIAIDKLTAIQVFDTREAADAYERDRYPMLHESREKASAKER